LAAPAIWAGILIFLYGVDVPFYDEWSGVCPLFEKMDAGTIRLEDFWAQHNEHRHFFPRLTLYFLGKLTHWNVRAELLAMWLLTVLTAWNIWRIMHSTGWQRSRTGFWLLFAAIVLLFSPLHVENLLWGWQICFLLPLFLFTASFWTARSARPPMNFFATSAICTACTFSMASGFTCWILSWPLLLSTTGNTSWRNRRIYWGLWSAVFALNLFFYFHGYVKPPYHPSLWAAVDEPGEALRYWLGYLGLPFAFGLGGNFRVVCQAAGAVLVVLLVCAAGYLLKWRHDSQLIKRALPWLMLALVAVTNASLTTIGRIGFQHFPSPRYALFAVLLPIGLSFMGVLILRHWREHSASNRGFMITTMSSLSVAFVLGLLHVLASIHSVELWKEVYHYRLTGKALVETINVVNEPDLLARWVNPDLLARPVPRTTVSVLKASVNFLDRVGYLRPGLVKSTFISKIGGAASPEKLQ